MTFAPRDPRATNIKTWLQSEQRCAMRVVVAVAHPDDECLAMGGRLRLLDDLTLIQLTDGAPRSAGAPEDYRTKREGECRAALARLGIGHLERVTYAIPDQEAAFALEPATRALVRDLATADVVFTHAYEGGHPDHDAAAFAVQWACDLLAARGQPAPARFEFASYHACDGDRVAGRFWPDRTCPEVVARLSPEALRLKRCALDCYRSQADVIAWFEPDPERYRPAPCYDFSRPPAPQSALYDHFGWPMTSHLWRELARSTIATLSGFTP